MGLVFATTAGLVIWIVHGLMYRWRRTRITDEAVEQALARVSEPFRRLTAWIAQNVRGNKAA